MNKERLKTGLEMMGVAADETALDRFEAFTPFWTNTTRAWI